MFGSFEFLSFGIVSYFEIRASHFDKKMAQIVREAAHAVQPPRTLDPWKARMPGGWDAAVHLQLSATLQPLYPPSNPWTLISLLAV
jgi:hypothetical protein